ncbi:MAG: Rieske (2Fe-2S) protein [Sphingobacteriaceae bacterium]|jgi:nitrite reductase/ring-hydroxylating ferredoxin subunit
MYHWIKIYDSKEAMQNNITLNRSEVFVLKGERVCISQTQEGFFAVQDKCPHNGASLSKGFCTEQNEIVCPLHRYKFDLRSGKTTAGGTYTLTTYPIDVRENGVFLGIKAKWWEM